MWLTESIRDKNLETSIVAEWIEASSIDKISEIQVQQCVEGRCEHETTGEQLYLIDWAVKNVTEDVEIIGVNDSAWTLRRKYCNAPRNERYGVVHINKSHIAINNVLMKMKLMCSINK